VRAAEVDSARRAATAVAGGVIAGLASEVLRVPLGDGAIDLLRPAELERFVDRDALLGAGEAAEPPYWMHLWPGALALARRLAGDAAAVAAGEGVLELGCGLALPGLAAARRGAAVTATDWKGAPLAFAAASAARNRLPLQVAQMEWAGMATGGRFSLCVGAEVAYDVAAEAALVQALGQTAAPRGRLLLADSVNTHRDTIVRRLVDGGWEVRVDGVFEREEGRDVWVRIIAARRRPGT